MAFQPRNNNHTQNTPTPSANDSSNSMDSLVDQIVDAVRDRLVAEGLPLAQNGTSNTVPRRQELPKSPDALSTNSFKRMVSVGADRISHTGETPFQPHVLQEDMGLARKIDHTLLKPDATPEEIKRMCEEARQYHFATVCVNSANVGLTAKLLEGSDVKAIAVVGFPLGAAATATKAFEAREAIRAGAQEIDMVINIGALKGGQYLQVYEDIKAVVEASKPYGVKVILETSSLNYDEKVIACAFSKSAGAAFVKTSTGFGSGGATAEDIELMRRIVGPDMGVKASGGIRSFEDAEKMINAGATRIGASASVAIVTKKATSKGSESAADSKAKKPFKNSLY